MLDTEHEMNRLTVATYVKKRVPFIALVLAASLIIATVADGTFRAVNASTPNPKQTSSEKAQNMKIKINIGGKTLTAILADNATARDFASVLPLTVSMKDLFGREKYGRFAQSAFRERSQKESIRRRRDRLLVSGPSVRRLLLPGWQDDSFARHHSDRQDRRWHGSIQLAGFGEGDD